MSEMTKTEARAAGGPNIAALPAPAADPLTELNEARAALQRALARLDELGAEKDALAAHLKSLEENPLIFTLNHLDAGAVLADAGEQLKAVAAAVSRQREKGSVTLTIGVRPLKGTAEALLFEPEVKAKVPKVAPEPGIFFSAEDGTIQRNDPRQRELGF